MKSFAPVSSLALPLVVVSGNALVQSDSRPISWASAMAAGGPTDVLTREIAQKRFANEMAPLSKGIESTRIERE